MSVSNLNDRPHFMLAIFPAAGRPVYRNVQDCITAVQAAAIVSSAQTLPHIDLERLVPGPLNAYIDCTIASSRDDAAAEEWRCYPSGEFRLRSGIWETADPVMQDRMRQNSLYGASTQPPITGFINLIALTYRVTAAYVFAGRWIAAFEHAQGLEVKVGIGAMGGWALGRIDQAAKFSPLPVTRTTAIEYRTSLTVAETPPNAYELAAEALVQICREAGWETTLQTFVAWQADIQTSFKRP